MPFSSNLATTLSETNKKVYSTFLERRLPEDVRMRRLWLKLIYDIISHVTFASKARGPRIVEMLWRAPGASITHGCYGV